MDFELKDFLDALGPNAALIFAAWIFLSFLQQRYVAAYDTYRKLIQAYREGDPGTPHMLSLREQVPLYKRRCEQMRHATTIGVWSAILIMVGLIAAGFAVIFGDNAFFRAIGAGGVMLGLVLVIVAATYVLQENRSIELAIQEEPSDIPELAERMDEGVKNRRQGQRESLAR
jgi:hypothetical protein